MDNLLQNVCPVCNRDDAIRKVSSIVSSQSMTGYFTGRTIDMNGDFGMAFAQGSVSNRLAQALQPPKRPSRGFIESKGDYHKRFERWSYQKVVWENLYYCYRDDIVFLKFSRQFKPPYKATYLDEMASTLNHVPWVESVFRVIKDAFHIPTINDSYDIDDPLILELLDNRVPHLFYNFERDREAVKALEKLPGVVFDKYEREFQAASNIKVCFDGDYDDGSYEVHKPKWDQMSEMQREMYAEEVRTGFYETDLSSSEVGIYGQDLDGKFWKKAKKSLERHGGYLISELKPSPSFFDRLLDKLARPEDVEFLNIEEVNRGDYKETVVFNYLGPSEGSAKAFLLRKKIPGGSDTENIIVVKTPEGNFSKSDLGIKKI